MSLTSNDAPADGFSREVMAAYENWSYSSLPPSVVKRIKLFVLDTLGVIGAASDAPGIPEVNSLLLGWEGAGPSTMLIGKGRVAPPTAALANGAAAHALDFDDNHDPGRVHSYAVILPAALAAAEARGGVSGRELIAALATGVELQARLGLAAPNSMSKGWHPTTVMGAMGAAAAAARVLGLRGGQFSDAVALAFHQASGTRQALNDGVLAKRLGAGFASRNGTAAAFLAAVGLTGPTRFLEGEAGLFQLYERGEVLPDALMRDLGQTWELMTHSMKPYPCCRCTHNAIAIGRALHREGLSSTEIESVVIGMSEVNTKIVGEPYDVATGLDDPRPVQRRLLLRGGAHRRQRRCGDLPAATDLGSRCQRPRGAYERGVRRRDRRRRHGADQGDHRLQGRSAHRTLPRVHGGQPGAADERR